MVLSSVLLLLLPHAQRRVLGHDVPPVFVFCYFCTLVFAGFGDFWI